MSDTKDFVTTVGSDQRKTPVRVAFITRRTSPAVRAVDEPTVQTFPEVLFRVAIAVQLMAVVLVLVALFFNAPLEGLADPSHTPNPAKAPWYFLGLQELLHYFPPFVAGVIVPTLVVLALIVIPYFNINIEAAGLFKRSRQKRIRIFWISALAFCIFLAVFDVIVALVPTLIMVGLMALAAYTPENSPSRFRQSLAAKPLSYWIMTWFLFELVVLTVVGTFFRGPGWSWVLPWSS
jgi:hypothetical protein